MESTLLMNARRDSLSTRGGRHIYEKASEADRARFHDALDGKLRELASRYLGASPVDDEQHIRNIRELREYLSERFADCLNKGSLTFGVAQKALNVYLKYLWCAGRLQTDPPHCPFDSVILKALRNADRQTPNAKWTEASEEVYRKWVKQAKECAAARNGSLNRWELAVYAQRKGSKASRVEPI